MGKYVPWHEVLGCAVCDRKFWGEAAFCTHYPCTKTEWSSEPGEYYQVHSLKKSKQGQLVAVFYEYETAEGPILVLLEEVPEYIRVQEKMRKVRDGRGKKKTDGE